MTGWMTTALDCESHCDIPAGKAMVRVPTPRHAWGDIIRCPNCGQCFLIRDANEIAARGEKVKNP